MSVLPTLDTLCSPDERRLDFELRLATVRGQATVVQALLDAVERFTDAPIGPSLAQLAEEISLLGLSALAAAAEMRRAPVDAEAQSR